MALTTRQTQLVQSSFTALLRDVNSAARTLYDRLVELDPSFVSMFKHADTLVQGRQFIRMVLTTVAALENPGKFTLRIHELAQRHAEYGVQPEHYRLMSDAVIWTLGRRLGTTFTPEAQAAWATLYDDVAAVVGAVYAVR
jgi:nitric oxide dioxygenase